MQEFQHRLKQLPLSALLFLYRDVLKSAGQVTGGELGGVIQFTFGD